MYKHILIAVDGSVFGHKAVVQGLELADALNAKASAITVTEQWAHRFGSDLMSEIPNEDYDLAAAATAEKILTIAKNAAATVGVKCDVLHVKEQSPAEGIIASAETLGCDLIVMASHGHRGLTRLLLGSVANEVVALSKVPVLICR